jgi:hypothetical protein
MAEVFLGYDDLLHRPVAIKRLRPQYAAFCISLSNLFPITPSSIC